MCVLKPVIISILQALKIHCTYFTKGDDMYGEQRRNSGIYNTDK